MNSTDADRELAKVEMALEYVVAHLSHVNEANAALHLSDRVLYSPLTVTAANALESVRKLRAADVIATKETP